MPETGILIPTGACRISAAEFSPCGDFRYSLRRRWFSDGEEVAFIGLNPSTADARCNDPTVSRCIARAKRDGFSGMWMLNLFSWRSTDPMALYQRHENGLPTIGDDNDAAILRVCRSVKRIVCCWGVHGNLGGRDLAVKNLLAGLPLHCLGLTRDGHPRHPLYLQNLVKPEVYR